jgi:hypothetical protein
LFQAPPSKRGRKLNTQFEGESGKRFNIRIEGTRIKHTRGPAIWSLRRSVSSSMPLGHHIGELSLAQVDSRRPIAELFPCREANEFEGTYAVAVGKNGASRGGRIQGGEVPNPRAAPRQRRRTRCYATLL